MRIVQVSVGSVRIPPNQFHAPLQVIFNTAKHLASMGQQVVILDRKYSQDDPSVEQVEGVRVARLAIPQIQHGKLPGLISLILDEFNAFLFALGVSRYLGKNRSRIDVIHLHLTSIGLIVITLNWRLRNKMFYTCHLSQWAFIARGLLIPERIHLLLDSWLMRRVRKVIALSETAKESFVTLGKVKRENIVVLPNGVDTAFFNPEIERRESIRKAYGLEGKLSVLFVGKLASIKGVQYLMRAANIVINEFGHKEAVFLLVGPNTFAGVDKPVDAEEMLEYINYHQMDKNIIRTGSLPLEQVRDLYAACDIFVLPSLAEADPLVVVEAMASGKPLIGTKIGGIPHKIRDGWNGFLVDPANEQQLGDKIRYLIDNPEERKRMGANSRKYAEEEFDWRSVSEKLLSIYRNN